MSVVQGLIVQDKFSILAEPSPKQLLLRQWDHYLLSDIHSLSTSFPLFSFFLLSSLFTTRAFSGNWYLCGFLECLCEGDGGRRWLFIGGRGSRAGALGRWAGAHLWCPSWVCLLHLLPCFDLTQNNVVWWWLDGGKMSGEWKHIGGWNNVMGCMWGVVYDMWDPRSVGHASRRLRLLNIMQENLWQLKLN